MADVLLLWDDVFPVCSDMLLVVLLLEHDGLVGKDAVGIPVYLVMLVALVVSVSYVYNNGNSNNQ